MIKVASIILLNRKYQILLQLRDDKLDLPYPNMWTLPGGSIEQGESPRECIDREMEEEMGIKIAKFQPLIILIKQAEFIEHVYWTRIKLNIDSITLTEGQKVQWFSEAETSQMQLAFECSTIVQLFWEFLKDTKSKPFPRHELLKGRRLLGVIY